MRASTLGTKAKAQEGETRWTDDRIRWIEDTKTISISSLQDALNDNKNDRGSSDDEDEEEEEGGQFDIFKPDPRATFSFEFAVPDASTSTSTVTSGDNTIQMHLKGYTHESDQIYVSTGLTLWRSAEHLCHYIIQNRERLKDSRILELGAGLGLNGILASLFTRSTTVLTDGDTNALDQLRQNVRENAFAGRNKDANGFHHGTVQVKQLLWGRDTSLDFLKRHDSKTFDVLLASDVVYVQDIIVPFFETVDTLMSRPNGVLYFAYCSRRQVPVKIEAVLHEASSIGLTHECVDEKDDIFVYLFRWQGS